MHDPDIYAVMTKGWNRRCEGFEEMLWVVGDSVKDGGKVDEVTRYPGGAELIIRPRLSFRLLGAADICVEQGKLYGAVHARNQPNWVQEKKIFVTTDAAGNSMGLEGDDYEIIATIQNK